MEDTRVWEDRLRLRCKGCGAIVTYKDIWTERIDAYLAWCDHEITGFGLMPRAHICKIESLPNHHIRQIFCSVEVLFREDA